MFWNKKSKKEKYRTVELTDETFGEAVSKARVPVLVDFYAEWCGPCKVLGPIIDELAEENEGKALIVKVNTEHSPGLSQHFKIKSIPTLMIFNRGKFMEKFQGIVPKPNLQEIIDEYIETNRLVPMDEEE